MDSVQSNDRNPNVKHDSEPLDLVKVSHPTRMNRETRILTPDRMEPEDEENQYASIRHSNRHRRHVYFFAIGARAERGGGSLQVEMCWVPWRGRNRFGDGEEIGRPTAARSPVPASHQPFPRRSG